MCTLPAQPRLRFGGDPAGAVGPLEGERDHLMPQPARYDHAEAVRRWREGVPTGHLAAEYGVSMSAINQAILRADPYTRELLNKRSREYLRRRYKRPCAGGCGRDAWWGPSRSATGLCSRCAGARKAFTVRPASLLCGECGEWKPDVMFPAKASSIARRGRATVCRDCQAPVRQRLRESRKIPCVQCGGPRSPSDGRRPDTGLCRGCFARRNRSKEDLGADL